MAGPVSEGEGLGQTDERRQTRNDKRETTNERRQTRNDNCPATYFDKMFLTLEHKKFDVYTVSSQLLLECYRIVIKLPATELYNLSQQIKRAAVSVRLNLAEGSSRKSLQERIRFYEIARGSLVEIDAAFEICVGLNYVKEGDLQNVGKLLNRVFAMLTKMISVNSQ